MDREGILTKVRIKMDEATPPGVELPFDDFIGPILDECAKEVAQIAPLHLLSPLSMINSSLTRMMDGNIATIGLGIHPYQVGDSITVSGFPTAESYYNGDFIITAITSTSISYPVTPLVVATEWISESGFDVFTNTGLEISVAQNAAGICSAESDIQFATVAGTKIRVQGTLALNSAPGTEPVIFIDNSDIKTLAVGVNDIELVATTSIPLGIATIYRNGATDYTFTGVSITKTTDPIKDYTSGLVTFKTISVNDLTYITKPLNFLRLYEMKFPLWVKPVRETTKPDSDGGKIQDNPYLASGIGRPSVVLKTTRPTGGSLGEYLICGKVTSSSIPTALFVKTPKPEDLPDLLIDSLTWLCSSKVLQISGYGDKAQGAMQQYQLTLTQLAQA